MLLSKMPNIIFCTTQVLLLYVTFCLPPLHTYWEIGGFRLQIRKGLINSICSVFYLPNKSFFVSLLVICNQLFAFFASFNIISNVILTISDRLTECK